MNVASLSNCKKLYELSGWADTYFTYGPFAKGSIIPAATIDKIWLKNENCPPAYDAGCLLRKLQTVDKKNDFSWIRLEKQPRFKRQYTDDGQELKLPEHYEVYITSCQILFDDNANPIEFIADTPEDALCLLAMQLFEEGVLKK